MKNKAIFFSLVMFSLSGFANENGLILPQELNNTENVNLSISKENSGEIQNTNTEKVDLSNKKNEDAHDFSSVMDFSTLSTDPLKNKSIDKIFISFLQERADEELKRAAEEEEARRLAQEQKDFELKLALSKKNPYYGMSSSEAEREAAELRSRPDTEETVHELTKEEKALIEAEENRAALYQAQSIEINVYGTSCYKEKCVAFTSLGEFKENKTIKETGEKILKITPTYIKTNLRKMKI